MQNPLFVGAELRHIKRGSLYRVLTFASGDLGQLRDNAPADLVVQAGSGVLLSRIVPQGQGAELAGFCMQLRLPLTVQVSASNPNPAARMVVYQALVDGSIWARPEVEFTPDRFQRLDWAEP